MTQGKQKRQEMFLEALDKSAGNISEACRQVKISRRSYYVWMEDDTFAEKVNEITESIIDLAESKLLQRINGYKEDDVHISNYQGEITATPIKKIYPPDPTSIIFFLKTRAKHRGYIERQEVEHSGQIVNIEEERTYVDGKD